MSASIKVVPANSRRQLRQFARFNYVLYRNCPYSVPDLFSDIVDLMTPSGNAAFEFCDVQPFLAYRDGKVVGRVTALINRKANQIWKTNTVRFGWIDFIDDIEVSAALMKAVEDWGREHGMTRVEGPLGFTDFDPEGMLTEGFDKLSTQATIYNYPYYPVHMEKLGYSVGAKWVEWHIPYNDLPDKMFRISKAVLERYDLHLAKYGNDIKADIRKYVNEVFRLINEAYAPLHGYSPISEKQIQDYINKYMSIIDYRFVSIVQDKNDQVVAVGMVMPSLSRALQKARGRMFPFGWWHLLKAIKWKMSHTIDLLFLAVKPEYQNKGLNAVPFSVIMPTLIKMGFQQGESNPELETNMKMQGQWAYFNGAEIHKRRCTFVKDNI